MRVGVARPPLLELGNLWLKVFGVPRIAKDQDFVGISWHQRTEFPSRYDGDRYAWMNKIRNQLHDDLGGRRP